MLNLTDEFRRLNKRQKDAVKAEGNTVVLAGPGSGKTGTLVIKVAHLLAEKISPPAGLACITFNNDAVREFRSRLSQFGIHARGGLFLGTVHSFCLNCVLRPYAALAGTGFKTGIQVAGERRANEVLLQAAQAHIANADTRWLAPTITRFRRAKACGEDLSGFGDTDPLVVADYENLLIREGLIDFEGIILQSLELLTQHGWMREILAARFPWLVVDEYQDLGGPLHRIVISLLDEAGVRVFAVGDPDQTIYDFTGASPQYLNGLSVRSDFQTIRLRFNYRSGQKIITASQAALSPPEPRDYVPDPDRKDQGEVFFWDADWSFEDHARKAIEAIHQALKAGVRAEEIAIFYRARGPLPDAIRDALINSDAEFIWERDATFPTSPLIRWLQSAAAWSVSLPADREQTFGQLFRQFSDLLYASGQIEHGADSLDHRVALLEVLSGQADETTLLRDWLKEVESSLHLTRLLAVSEEYATDLETLEELQRLVEPEEQLGQARLLEFAAYGRVRGKVVLTTLHAAKGRQFDVVIIPGCAEGLLPSWVWNRQDRRWEPPSERPLAEQRRLFYVGLSRARRQIYLVCSEGYPGRYGPLRNGVSRFAKEIQDKLTTE